MDKYRCGDELELVHRHRLQQIPYRKNPDDRAALQDTQMAGVVMLHEIGRFRNRTALIQADDWAAHDRFHGNKMHRPVFTHDFSNDIGLGHDADYTVVLAAIVLCTAATLMVAATEIVAVALFGAFWAGAAWVGVLASLSAGTQSTAPAWVRARAVSINLLAVQSGLAIGSLLWGILASIVDTRLTLTASAVLMIVLYALNHRVHVELGDEADVTPFAQLPDLAIAVEPLPNDGPVLVQVEYRIDPESRPAFLRAIQAVEATRRRNGASSWRVFRDVGEDGRFVERYVIASWAEYVRLRMRMTIADRKLQDRVAGLQRRDVPIRVSRLIGVNPEDRPLQSPSHHAPGASR